MRHGHHKGSAQRLTCRPCTLALMWVLCLVLTLPPSSWNKSQCSKVKNKPVTVWERIAVPATDFRKKDVSSSVLLKRNPYNIVSLKVKQLHSKYSYQDAPPLSCSVQSGRITCEHSANSVFWVLKHVVAWLRQLRPLEEWWALSSSQ